MKKIIPIIYFLIVYLYGNLNYYQELSKNVNYFFNVYKKLNLFYVDSIDPSDFIENGVNSMLETLDPYTIVLENESKKQFDDLSKGEYGGIGIYLGKSDEDQKLMITSVMDNTPANKVGLRAGDKIIKIDDQPVAKMSMTEVSQNLRGKKGSSVVLTIKRLHKSELLNFTIIRDNIEIISVPFATILPDSIGYVKISRFSKNTAAQVETNLDSLAALGAKKIIIDLRYNGGGLLNEAVELSNLFLDKGKEIVSTKGRANDKGFSYFTKKNQKYDFPLAVLVNFASASASEIFSGAIQDYDRGLIIGGGTLGKGLVQRIYPLGNGKDLKITTSKYYTPSGRLIQKIDYFNKKEKENTSFYTVNGREVKSGQGIIPDILVEEELESEIINFLKMNNLFTSFIYDYLDEKEVQRFEAETIFSLFENFVKEHHFSYLTKGEKELDSLIAYIKGDQNSLFKDELENFNKIKKAIEEKKILAFRKNKEDIIKLLKIEYFALKEGLKGRYRLIIKDDPFVKKATENLENLEKYNCLLKITEENFTKDQN